jgi:acetyltransferase-like isoleucine patch superfamily enzyme
MILANGTKKEGAVRALYNKCKSSDTNLFSVVFRATYYKVFYRKLFLLHQKVMITHPQNIHCHGVLQIGIDPVGFMHPSDLTFINVKGSLQMDANYSIGRGCRFDIGKNAVVTIGRGGYINANSKIIITHKLSIGDNCSISWDCQFLDDDFHEIHYEGKNNRDRSIQIGNNVWVGAGAKIYKGTIIPDGCVVASDAIVRGIFVLKNCVIGGNPARVIKENVKWL